jgi:isochorismate synthase
MIPEVSNSSDLNIAGLSVKDVAGALFNISRDDNKSVALWRLPESDQIHLVTDLSSEISRIKADIERSDPGFIVSPFINPENRESIFIKAHVFYSSEGHSLSYADQVPEKDKLTFISRVKETLAGSEQKTSVSNVEAFETNQAKDKFGAIIDRALSKIREGKFKKVVLAREKKITSSSPINPVDLFFKLTENYSNAFISLISVPGIGVWIGASPELLLSVDKKKIFRTSSLAGTQSYQEGLKLSDCVWTQKEIEEQALVSRYIINCFKAIRLREYEDEGPRTVRAGNLLHLRTDFLADMTKLGFPRLGSQMLDLLHPTSAVCGMPKEEAMRFILEEEKFDRSIFTGFLGPVNINSASCIFVNLRCARLFHQSAVLYAGAGITQDSDPEKEWNETEMKMRTIGDFIH